jgi:hypothetical protein
VGAAPSCELLEVLEDKIAEKQEEVEVAREAMNSVFFPSYTNFKSSYRIR